MFANKLFHMILVGVTCIMLAGTALGVGYVLDAERIYAYEDEEVLTFDPLISAHIYNQSVNRGGIFYAPIDDNSPIGFVFNAGTGRYYAEDAVSINAQPLEQTDELRPFDDGTMKYSWRYSDTTRQILRVELVDIDAKYIGGAIPINLNVIPSVTPQEVSSSQEEGKIFIYNGQDVTANLGKPYNFGVPEVPQELGDGYNFAGWYLDEACTRPFIAPTTIVNGKEVTILPNLATGVWKHSVANVYNLALYPKFVQGYEVWFVNKDDTKVGYQIRPNTYEIYGNTHKGSPIVAPTLFDGIVPSAVIGYYSDKAMEKQFNFNSVTGRLYGSSPNDFTSTNPNNTNVSIYTGHRVIIYVKFQEHRVDYDVNGGIWTASGVTYDYNEYFSKIQAPASNPIRNGYEFYFWRVRLASNGVQIGMVRDLGLVQMQNQPLIIQAEWKIVNADIKVQLTTLKSYLSNVVREDSVGAELFSQWQTAHNNATQYILDGEVTSQGAKAWSAELHDILNQARNANAEVVQVKLEIFNEPEQSYVREEIYPLQTCIIIAGCILILGIMIILALDKPVRREVK